MTKGKRKQDKQKQELEEMLESFETLGREIGQDAGAVVGKYIGKATIGVGKAMDAAQRYYEREVLGYQGNPETAGKNYAKACAATVGTVIVGPALGILSIPAILAGLGFTSVMAYQSYRDYEELDKQGFK